MTLLPVLILAAGLNGAVSSPTPASHEQQAVTRMNRMVAATAPVLHRRAMNRAIAAGAQRIGTDIARELAIARVKAAATSPAQMQIGSTQPATETAPSLKAGQTLLFPKRASTTEKTESAAAGSSAQDAPAASERHLSVLLAGGLLTGFLALAGLAATAFSRWTR